MPRSSAINHATKWVTAKAQLNSQTLTLYHARLNHFNFLSVCMRTLKTLLNTTRPPFLILTPACVAVGVATAFWQNHQLNGWHVIVVLLGALARHISVNAFNEYFDFKSGLDATTKRTPFSGGSGTLPNHPDLATHTLWLACASLFLAAGVGIYFMSIRGWALLPLGLTGLLLLIVYTTWCAYHPILSLFSPGLGFGLLMVMGTHFALTGEYTWTALIASLPIFFLVNDLLLLNQFPDKAADQAAGRRNVVISFGRPACAKVYGLFLLIAYAIVILAVLLNGLPFFCLLALLSAPLAWKAFQGARQHADTIQKLWPAMGLNVSINIVTPLLLALGLFLG